jgi:hypothetical protein
VSLGSVEISVPSDWVIEDPGGVCGNTQGEVFVDQAPRTPPASEGCSLPPNLVEMATAGSEPLLNAHAAVVNGIRVLEGIKRSASSRTDVVRALGMQVDAQGPLAAEVEETITHSPLSVVIDSSVTTVPSAWRRVDFGGLRFSVPRQWTLTRDSYWGGCPGNIAPNALVLSTATQSMAGESCPPPPQTAGYLAANPGMLLGSGPLIGDAPSDASCVNRNGVHICIDSPPPTDGGYSFGQELNLLTAQVTIPGQSAVDQIEIGLTGTGIEPLEIVDSMKPDS